jgi:hypothetical protein
LHQKKIKKIAKLPYKFLAILSPLAFATRMAREYRAMSHRGVLMKRTILNCFDIEIRTENNSLIASFLIYPSTNGLAGAAWGGINQFMPEVMSEIVPAGHTGCPKRNEDYNLPKNGAKSIF